MQFDALAGRRIVELATHPLLMTRSILFSLAAGALLATSATAQLFTPGNVVVLRIGDPALTLSSAAAPVFLDEWDTTTNTLVQSVEIPNSQTGAVPSFSQRGYSSSEGCLTVSADGRYLIIAGYDRMIGGTSPGSEMSATTNRVVARVDVLTGLIDTSTALIDAYDAATFRGATSIDGSSFWLSGTSTNGSVRYATLGATTSQDIASSPSNVRWIDNHKGQLYITSASTGSMAQGVIEVGTGMPTTVGQATTLLPGFPTAGVFNDGAPYDFWFANDTTLYVADSAYLGTNCGVQKWTLAAGTWTKQYTIVVGATECIRGLNGLLRNGTAEIWFTAEPQGFVTSLYKVTDTGVNSTPVLISTEAAETDYRGVRVIPAFIGTQTGGCGTSSLQVSGPCLLGTNIEVDMLNASGFPFVNYSTTTLGLPLANCGCVILYDLGVLVGSASSAIAIPNNATLIGANLFLQGFDLFDVGSSCTSPVPAIPMSTTDGISITIF
ncbi:MAG: hypothetical protein ACI89X_002137 [Planctomycetota bacterium]|jgi:hypothetical protein